MSQYKEQQHKFLIEAVTNLKNQVEDLEGKIKNLEDKGLYAARRLSYDCHRDALLIRRLLANW